MRLIDADALIERLDDFNKWCKDERLQGSLFAVDVVGDMPTVCDIDAIRTDIEQLKNGHCCSTEMMIQDLTIDSVLQIIDRYTKGG